MSVAAFSGLVVSMGKSSTFQFAGPVTIVTTTGSQRLTGAAVASLATTASGNFFIGYGLCYQSNAGGAVTNFVGGNWVDSNIALNNLRSYSAAASTIPGPGTWKVGFCIMNPSFNVDNNDYVNGWVMVTN